MRDFMSVFAMIIGIVSLWCATVLGWGNTYLAVVFVGVGILSFGLFALLQSGWMDRDHGYATGGEVVRRRSMNG